MLECKQCGKSYSVACKQCQSGKKQCRPQHKDG